jgi:hypothetical protein
VDARCAPIAPLDRHSLAPGVSGITFHSSYAMVLSMRTRLLPFGIAMLGWGTPVRAQTPPTAPRTFPTAAFDSVARTAAWLAQYDRVAWETSALVTAAVPHLTPDRVDRIGAEWFCFERDSIWHAVYGRYDATRRRYDVVLHYSGRPGQSFVAATTPLDTALTARYGRALQMTRARLPAEVRDEGVQLTTFVRPRADGSLDVWYLPAFQPDGWAVYGIELRYTLDPDARRLTDSTAIIATLRGSLLDSTVTIEIDNERNPIPTVGQAFFATVYASRFDAIVIHDRDFISEFAMIDGRRGWVHDRRERPPPGE